MSLGISTLSFSLLTGDFISLLGKHEKMTYLNITSKPSYSKETENPAVYSIPLTLNTLFGFSFVSIQSYMLYTLIELKSSYHSLLSTTSERLKLLDESILQINTLSSHKNPQIKSIDFLNSQSELFSLIGSQKQTTYLSSVLEVLNSPFVLSTLQLSITLFGVYYCLGATQGAFSLGSSKVLSFVTSALNGFKGKFLMVPFISGLNRFLSSETQTPVGSADLDPFFLYAKLSSDNLLTDFFVNTLEQPDQIALLAILYSFYNITDKNKLIPFPTMGNSEIINESKPLESLNHVLPTTNIESSSDVDSLDPLYGDTPAKIPKEEEIVVQEIDVLETNVGNSMSKSELKDFVYDICL